MVNVIAMQRPGREVQPALVITDMRQAGKSDGYRFLALHQRGVRLDSGNVWDKDNRLLSTIDQVNITHPRVFAQSRRAGIPLEGTYPVWVHNPTGDSRIQEEFHTGPIRGIVRVEDNGRPELWYVLRTGTAGTYVLDGQVEDDMVPYLSTAYNQVLATLPDAPQSEPQPDPLALNGSLELAENMWG